MDFLDRFFDADTNILESRVVDYKANMILHYLNVHYVTFGPIEVKKQNCIFTKKLVNL